jgi:hypothetical protein
MPNSHTIEFLWTSIAVSNLASRPNSEWEDHVQLCPVEIDTLSLYRQKGSTHTPLTRRRLAQWAETAKASASLEMRRAVDLSFNSAGEKNDADTVTFLRLRSLLIRAMGKRRLDF